MNILPDIYFKTVFEWLSHGSLLQLLLELCDFLKIDNLFHKVVATYLRYDGILKYEFVVILQLSLSTIKNFKNR